MTNTEVSPRCAKCGIVLLFGNSHNCIPRAAVVTSLKQKKPAPLGEVPARTVEQVVVKPRAAKGTGIYRHRNSEKWRAYMREYIRKLRAK